MGNLGVAGRGIRGPIDPALAGQRPVDDRRALKDRIGNWIDPSPIDSNRHPIQVDPLGHPGGRVDRGLAFWLGAHASMADKGPALWGQVCGVVGRPTCGDPLSGGGGQRERSGGGGNRPLRLVSIQSPGNSRAGDCFDQNLANHQAEQNLPGENSRERDGVEDQAVQWNAEGIGTCHAHPPRSVQQSMVDLRVGRFAQHNRHQRRQDDTHRYLKE